MDDRMFQWALGCAIAVGGMWLIRLVMIEIGVRRRQILSESSYPKLSADAPKLSMIIAAKDEEANIESCVTSLLEQDYPNLELIIVDDRSTDRTPEILSDLEQSSDGRLKVITVEELEDGWFGKNNAMRVGVEQSTGDWFCFSDADCRQISRRSLSVAMADAMAHDSEFLTIAPVLDTDSLWEKVTQPICVEMLMFWFHPSLVNNPKSQTAYANGAFMMMSRNCYDSIGGHERVRTEVNEDIHMARYAKSGGFGLRMVENDGLYRAKMYRSPSESFRGWSRIFFGSLGSRITLSASIASILFSTLLPWCMLFVSLAGMVQAGPASVGQWQTLTAIWCGIIAIHHVASYRFYVTQDINQFWSLAYPVGASLTMGMLINGLMKQLGLAKTTWRGTTYLKNERVESLQPQRVDAAA